MREKLTHGFPTPHPCRQAMGSQVFEDCFIEFIYMSIELKVLLGWTLGLPQCLPQHSGYTPCSLEERWLTSSHIWSPPLAASPDCQQWSPPPLPHFNLCRRRMHTALDLQSFKLPLTTWDGVGTSLFQRSGRVWSQSLRKLKCEPRTNESTYARSQVHRDHTSCEVLYICQSYELTHHHLQCAWLCRDK